MNKLDMGCKLSKKVTVTEEYFTFDDVLLVPKYSEIVSRRDVNLSVVLGEMYLNIPILAANMDSVTGYEMAKVLSDGGAGGVLHRFAPVDEIMSWCKRLLEERHLCIPSVGVQGADFETAMQYRDIGVEHICVDVAHGDSKRVCDMTEKISKLGFKTVIVGNVATGGGVMRLASAGANVIKVGIGPSTVCSTRGVTGNGVPQLSAIIECSEYADRMGVQIVADGGMKSSGDIAKAIAAGASAVMTGTLFAGCQETPRRGYRGNASAEAQVHFKGKIGNDVPEGVSIHVSDKGSADLVLKELAGGLRSAFSYQGASNMEEFHEDVVFVRCSPNTVVENGTRQLK